MEIKQYEIWLANLNPSKGTEPGKIRPVIVIQTNLLNGVHPSTVVCPVTSNVIPNAQLLRVRLDKGQTDVVSDVLVDQIRAIDNKRFIQRIGRLNDVQIHVLKQNLMIVLDL
jgi:mRNA interferase MazF